MSAIRRALAIYGVLVFTARNLTTEHHLAANFGPLEETLDVAMKRDRLRMTIAR